MTMTTTRRVRTPHFITGLGDGDVRKHKEASSQISTDDLFRRPTLFDRGNVRRRQPLKAPSREPPPDFVLADFSEDAPSSQQGPWQVSAMALLCVMGLLLALFLQVMTDGNNNTTDHQQHHKKKVTYRHSRKTKKKKTDEWSEDEPAGSSYNADTEASAAAAPLMYSSSSYPYQPRYQQQQHRHRKISGSGHSELNYSASKSPVIINSRPYYHHNVSGSNKSSFATTTTTTSPSSRSPVGPPRGTTGVGHGLEGFSTTETTPRPPPIRAQPLSPVSSFCSLGAAGDDDDTNTDNGGGTPSSPKRAVVLPSHSFSGNCSQSSLFMSPGKQDFVTPKAGRRRRVALPPPQDLIDTAVPYSGSLPPPPAAALPFIPDLNNRDHMIMRSSSSSSPIPPRSLDDDDTAILRMESGDMSSSSSPVWEEPTKHRAYPGHPSPLRKTESDNHAMVQAAAAAASPNPRNNIIHKRKDLTLATDAGSSLTSSIDFDELRLEQVIGGGGFGQVWRATWRGTPVAVKVLTASAQAELKSIMLEEFAAEINMLKGMRHPNICLYMGACLEPPNRAIVTELAANGSLWDALRLPLQPPFEPCNGLDKDAWPNSLGIPPEGTWPWALVKRVACGAARGMTYLHSGSPPVLHRDLKSANLLLDDAYTTKVCDFGLSRLKAQQRSSMTGNCGTVQWMAPEVLANQHYAEPADVYSFGIILWELLTRECPYDGMSAIQCALAVLNRNHRPPLPDWCPPALAALILASVEKEPSKRPTFGQIILALDAMP